MTKEQLLIDLELLKHWDPTPMRRVAIIQAAIDRIKETT